MGNSLGEIIKSERVRRHWSQEKLGKKIGLSGKQISKYENEKLNPPTYVMKALCKAFECDLGYLLGDENYSEGDKLTTAIVNELKLSPETIDCLKKMSQKVKIMPDDVLQDQNIYMRIINKLLSAHSFFRLIDAMADLKISQDRKYENIRAVEKEYGSEFVDAVSEKYQQLIFDYEDPDVQWPSDLKKNSPEAMVIYALRRDLDVPFPDYTEKVYRYEIGEAFSLLVNEMFPKTE